MGFDRKRGTLFLEILTEFIEVSMDAERKVIRAPLIMTDKILEKLYAVCPGRLLTRPLATDKDSGALKSNTNLRGTAEFRDAS